MDFESTRKRIFRELHGMKSIPFIAFCASSSPANSLFFHVGNPLDSWADTALTVDHRSALRLKSLQVVERFGVPDGI